MSGLIQRLFERNCETENLSPFTLLSDEEREFFMEIGLEEMLEDMG